MRDYTTCLECKAIFPTELEVGGEDAERHCPICDSAGICSIEDIDVEEVVQIASEKHFWACPKCGVSLIGLGMAPGGLCFSCWNKEHD